MKESKPIKEIAPEDLPFSFVQHNISEEKIKAHWKRIEEQIKNQLPAVTDGEDDSNEFNPDNYR